MDKTIHDRIVSLIWGIADDVLRDLLKRGKHPDIDLALVGRMPGRIGAGN